MLRKILIVGYTSEGTLSHFLSFLINYNINYDILDLSSISLATSVKIQFYDNNLIITIDDKVYHFNEYQSFYLRYYYYELESSIYNQCLSDLTKALNAYLNNTKSLVINRPLGGRSNGTKLYHLILLKDSGFNTPESYIFGSAIHANKIISDDDTWVSKGCSGTRTVVEKIDQNLYENLYKIDSCPSQFQKYISGVDVRTHVIGEEFVSLEISSELVDYRYAEKKGYKNEYRLIETPDDIQKKCLDFCKKEKLLFAGFDFKINSKNGKWVVLEANPMPGYEFFDKKVDELISGHLANLLLSEYKDSYFFDFERNLSSDIFISEDRIPEITPF